MSKIVKREINFSEVDLFSAKTFHLSQVWDVISSGVIDTDKCENEDDKEFLNLLAKGKTLSEEDMLKIKKKIGPLIIDELKKQIIKKINDEDKGNQDKIERKKSCFSFYLENNKFKESYDSLGIDCWAKISNIYWGKGNKLSIPRQIEEINKLCAGGKSEDFYNYLENTDIKYTFQQFKILVKSSPSRLGFEKVPQEKEIPMSFIEYIHKISHAFSEASLFFFRYNQSNPQIIFPVLKTIIKSTIKGKLPSIIKEITSYDRIDEEKIEEIPQPSFEREEIAAFDEFQEKWEKDKKEASEILKDVLLIFKTPAPDIDTIPKNVLETLNIFNNSDTMNMEKDEFIPKLQKQAILFLIKCYCENKEMREFIKNIGIEYKENSYIVKLIEYLESELKKINIDQDEEKQNIFPKEIKIDVPKDGISIPVLSEQLKEQGINVDVYKIINEKFYTLQGKKRLNQQETEYIVNYIEESKRYHEWIEALCKAKNCNHNTAIQTIKRRRDKILNETNWKSKWTLLDPFYVLRYIPVTEERIQKLFLEKHTGSELLQILEDERAKTFLEHFTYKETAAQQYEKEQKNLRLQKQEQNDKKWIEFIMRKNQCSSIDAIESIEKIRNKVLKETDWDEEALCKFNPFSSMGIIEPTDDIYKRLFTEEHTGPEILEILEEATKISIK